MASSAYTYSMFLFAFNKDYQHGSLLLTSPNFVVSRFSIDTIVNIKCFIGDNIKVVLLVFVFQLSRQSCRFIIEKQITSILYR